jgi:heptaprenyl diphosphate synthase
VANFRLTDAVPVELADSALAADLAADLGLVERELRGIVHPTDEVLTEVARHGIEAGGKRFRPMLVLLAARFGDPADPRVIQAATAVELTHLATLFHDDVMDEAALRRGHESVNARWSNSVAILAGDWLFARASDILAELGAEAIKIQADTFSRLVSGQLAETVGARPGQDPLDHYMYVISEKTGSLIATSGRFGAMFSGAADKQTHLIARACEQLGVAWQLSDDVIDIASDSDESGKSPGTDLRQGIRTLPVFYALRSASPSDPRLRELLSKPDLADPGLHAEALELLRSSQAIEQARAEVRRWAYGAKDLLSVLPDAPARQAFETLCDYVITRTG